MILLKLDRNLTDCQFIVTNYCLDANISTTLHAKFTNETEEEKEKILR